MNKLKMFALLFCVAGLLAACNSSSQTPITKRESYYPNGAPFSVIHYNKDKKYIGTHYYPDGTPMNFSRGSIRDIDEKSISLNYETSLNFYPDGTIIPKQILKEKDFAYDIFGTIPFADNGKKLFADFCGKRIGNKYILSLYVYPDSKNGEIIDRFILKCAYKSSKWVAKLDTLFGIYKFGHSITKDGELSVKLLNPTTNEKILELNGFKKLKELKNRNHKENICNIDLDKGSAVKIAEALLCHIYGDKVLQQKPWIVKETKETFIIKGTLHSKLGGVAKIEISKKTGSVLNYIHGK